MESLRKEEIIQAVLIADTYNENFQPFGAEGSPVSMAIKISAKRKLFTRISQSAVYVAACEYSDDRLCIRSAEQEQSRRGFPVLQ